MNTPSKWFTPLAVLALIWNLLGCMAFTFDMMLTEEDIAQLSAAEQALYESRPIWAVVGTALAVIVGALGCIGMIMKKSWSVPCFVVSLVGLVLQDIHLFWLSDAIAIYGSNVYIMQGIVFVIAVALLHWSRSSKQQGYLA